jgi:hypothetical protein
MDARLSPSSSRRRRWVGRPWIHAGVVLLLVAGALLQACSDNNGTTGPTFACNETPLGQGKAGNTRALAACTSGNAGPAQITGDGSGATGVLVLVQVSPATVDIGRRASVTVIATSTGGFRLGGQREVFLNTSLGSLEPAAGTMVDGVFRTTLSRPCGLTAGEGEVVASVGGAVSKDSGAFTAATPTTNNPCS